MIHRFRTSPGSPTNFHPVSLKALELGSSFRQSCYTFDHVKIQTARRRMTPANDAVQSAIFPQKMMEQQTSNPYHDSQEPTSRALVHVITPSYKTNSLHLSILPSFLSHLPQSIHTLRISFVLSHLCDRQWDPRQTYFSKLSNFSLERVKNVVDKDGVVNLHITIHHKNATVTLLELEGPAPTVENDAKSDVDSLASYGDPYTRTFPFFRENAIFTPIASYSKHEDCFLPISEDESPSLPSLLTASIIQLSVPPLHVTPCLMSRLPVELLTLIFNFLDQTSNLSDVCQLWHNVSAPYWKEPAFVAEKYVRLKRYPGAGLLWDRLTFDVSMDIGMVKEVTAGSPNVRIVRTDAFWNEEAAKIVLNAIGILKRVHSVTLGRGSRKWRKEEIEKFMRRMGDRIREFTAYDVEDSPASASAGLHLSSRLEHLDLYKYPPFASLSLPRTLTALHLSNICALPSSISDYPLPPLLVYLTIELSPFIADGKTSILPNPFNLSYLTRLTELILDGGEETSNLVSPSFFSTLKNARLIYWITLQYCVVDTSDFPDFIRWFFGDWRVRGIEKGDQVDRKEIGRHLKVRVFFGEWTTEEIAVARLTMDDYPRSKESGVSEDGEGENWW